MVRYSSHRFVVVTIRDNASQRRVSSFLRNLAGSLPPMLQIMKDIGGVEMPEFFGRIAGEDKTTAAVANGQESAAQAVEEPDQVASAGAEA